MMQIDVIERYVDQVLEVNGFCKGDKELLRQLLHRLYTAATMFHLMTEEQRALIGRIQMQLSPFFVTKCNLKEGKRKGRKRNIPPIPPIKEKAGQEKGEKTNYLAKRNILSSLDARKQAFYDECQKLKGKYAPELVDDFYCHWSEENKKDGKMLFEYERTWNTAKRMHKWDSNPISRAKKAAVQRLEKAKDKGKTTDTAKQQQTAAERDDANEQLFQQIAENKKKAVSWEEYLAKKNENEK